MTKTVLVLAGVAIAAVLLGSALAVGMFTPKVEATENGNGIPSDSFATACLPEEVKHWDKIIFQILRDPSGTVDPSNLKTPLDIKVLDDPNSVANIDSKIRDFIKDFPRSIAVPGTTLTEDAVDKLKIDIIDVEYAIVCVQQPPLPPFCGDGVCDPGEEDSCPLDCVA